MIRKCMTKGIVNLTAPDEQRAAFAARLRSFTADRGMAGKIAAATNTSLQAVRRWAAGETEPSRDKLVAMANYLGVTHQWLIAGELPKWKSELSTELVRLNDPPYTLVLQTVEGLFEWLEGEGVAYPIPAAQIRDLIEALSEQAHQENKQKDSEGRSGEESGKSPENLDIGQYSKLLRVAARIRKG